MSIDFVMWSQFKQDQLVAMLASDLQIRQRQITIEAVIPGSTVAIIEFGAFNSIRAATNAQLRLQSLTLDAASQQEFGTMRLTVSLIYQEGSTTTSAAPNLTAATEEEKGLDTWEKVGIIAAVAILLLALVILTITSCRQSHAQGEMTRKLSQAVLGNPAFSNTFSDDASPAQSTADGLSTYYPSPFNGPDFFVAETPSETTKGSLNRNQKVRRQRGYRRFSYAMVCVDEAGGAPLLCR